MGLNMSSDELNATDVRRWGRGCSVCSLDDSSSTERPSLPKRDAKAGFTTPVTAVVHCMTIPDQTDQTRPDRTDRTGPDRTGPDHATPHALVVLALVLALVFAPVPLPLPLPLPLPYIYIYIYIERERERYMCVYVCVYI